MGQRFFPSIWVGFFLALYGCASTPLVISNADSLPAAGKIVLTNDIDHVSIMAVDNQSATSFKRFFESNWFPTRVELPPGQHRFFIRYERKAPFPRFQTDISDYWFSLDGVAGHEYRLKATYYERSAKVWIEDAASGERVGRVYASRNEPADTPGEVFAHSNLYTMLPPAGEGWTVLYRNAEGIMLRKRGARVDETYAVYVKLVILPKFASTEDFAEHVESEQVRDLDQKRFKNHQQVSALYDGRSDYCLSYQASVEDWQARKRTPRNPMILEMSGYFCRHPENKNVGIAFDYSHRCFDDQLDPQLSEKARMTFDNLKF